ncbi:TetR/AcrR family transcriptional regulator [Symbioplanes lichenis]|uniref:TetR/AcrR family transcriptional regulator n=1 Tax=Symbioplanes lichenis TaxID=1629072 RepID=UPI0027392AFB|nr:helix-turn-helix domain-containing protein [Actinoplanes lichenis]
MRRSDTRERIRATALELFITQGYEHTSLAQVADRLGITRPAVYHHFRSKEEVLTGAYAELLPLVERAAGDPAPLDRISELLAGEFGDLLTCSRVNEHALRGMPAAVGLMRAFEELAARVAPGSDVESRMRGRLAIDTLMMAAIRADRLGGTPEERRQVALRLARDLIRR